MIANQRLDHRERREGIKEKDVVKKHNNFLCDSVLDGYIRKEGGGGGVTEEAKKRPKRTKKKEMERLLAQFSEEIILGKTPDYEEYLRGFKDKDRMEMLFLMNISRLLYAAAKSSAK